jgi:UDP-N-acetylglucosamine 2-epimerase (non-hydrolysing)
VQHVRGAIERGELAGVGGRFDRAGKRLILVTAHRRESFGGGFERICRAISTIADRGDVHVVYPVHPNPNVQAAANERLGGHPDIELIEPLDYAPFVDLMRRAYIILTDSGGIQEEGPSLGKPVLVLREKTERPEAVSAGTVKLVGTNVNRIVEEVTALLDREDDYRRMSLIHNPYGDGRACERIEAVFRTRGASDAPP